MVPHFSTSFFWILPVILVFPWTPKALDRTFTSLDDRQFLEYHGEQKLRLHRDKTSANTLLSDSIPTELERPNRLSDSRKTTSRFMLELYGNLQRGDDLAAATGHRSGPMESIRADTIRCYSSSAKILGNLQKVQYEYWVPRLPLTETIQLAEFRIPKQGDGHHPRKLKISMVRRGQLPIEQTIVREKPSISTDKKHLVYDITKSMELWLNGYHGNITVRFHVRRMSTAPESIGQGRFDETQSNDQGGLLVLYSEDKDFLETVYSSYTEQDAKHQGREKTRGHRSSRDVNKRRKRKRNNGKGSSKKWKKPRKPCQKHDFEVDFDSIGWGKWIIFPKKFNAFLCHGSCPSPIKAKLQPTNHAMMQSLMRDKHPNIAPMPCCTPSKLKPMSMLYYEHDEIVLRHHEDMIADECACH